MQLNLSNIFIWKYFYKTIMYVLHNWAMLLQSFQGKREETVEEGGSRAYRAVRRVQKMGVYRK